MGVILERDLTVFICYIVASVHCTRMLMVVHSCRNFIDAQRHNEGVRSDCCVLLPYSAVSVQAVLRNH